MFYLRFSVNCALLFCLLAVGQCLPADEPEVVFDVPAMLAVQELIEVGVPPISPFKIIEIVIPVTAEIRPADRDNVDEFRFDVSWSGHTFPIADYGPKSQTVSHIDGNISVDQSDDHNVGIGINASSDRLEIATLNGNADFSSRSTARKAYKEIPQHHPVIASGTIMRGTGAFFRFHRSRTETLEGGREVVVAYRVGRDWRGGILKVKCRAIGKRKIFGSFTEPIDEARSFIVPIYLDGNVEANRLATDFVVAEQGLRRHWHRRQSHSKSKGELLLASLNPFGEAVAIPAGFNFLSGESELPQRWLQQLIEASDDHLLNRIEGQLPQSTAMLANEFALSRKRLSNLGRKQSVVSAN